MEEEVSSYLMTFRKRGYCKLKEEVLERTVWVWKMLCSCSKTDCGSYECVSFRGMSVFLRVTVGDCDSLSGVLF